MMAKLWGILWRGVFVFGLTVLSLSLLSNGVGFVLNHRQMLQYYDVMYSPLLWICNRTSSYDIDVKIFGTLWIVLIVLALGALICFYSILIWKRRWHKGLLWLCISLVVIQNWVGSFFTSFWIPGGIEVLQAVVDEMARARLEQIQEGIETEQPPCDTKTEEPVAEVIPEDKNVP